MRFLNDAHTIKVPFVSLCGWLAWWGVRVLPKPRNVSVNSWANLVCRWFRSIQADRSMRYNLFHLQHTLDIRMAVYSTFKATNLCNTIIIIISLIRTNVTENRFFFFHSHFYFFVCLAFIHSFIPLFFCFIFARCLCHCCFPHPEQIFVCKCAIRKVFRFHLFSVRSRGCCDPLN